MVTIEIFIWTLIALLLLGALAFFILLSEIRANREEMWEELRARHREENRDQRVPNGRDKPILWGPVAWITREK